MKCNEVLGVDDLTDDEIAGMAKVTSRGLFEQGYHKSDAILDMMKIFDIDDTPLNRKFALTMWAVGAAHVEASRKLDCVMEAVKILMPEE